MILRLPGSLHEQLKRAARAEGVSLNQYCLYSLASHTPTTQELETQRAEELLKFIQEAQILQKEMEKNRS